MASSLNLRQYQQDIIARLSAAKGAATSAVDSRLGVMVGKDHVLVNLADISEVLPLPMLHAVPLTHPWFLGMANVRGRLYTINDLSQLLEQSVLAKTADSRLLLVNQQILPQVGLVVERVIGLRNLKQLTIKKTKKAKAFCYKNQTYHDDDGFLWYELDCRLLTAAKIFMQPGIG